MSDHSRSARQVLGLVANKWTIPVTRCLLAAGRRPSEMMVLIEGISQKMLLQTLRQMEQRGLVARKVHAVVPPRVDYLLTPLGRSLVKPINVLERWMQAHAAEIGALEIEREPPVKPEKSRRPGKRRPGLA